MGIIWAILLMVYEQDVSWFHCQTTAKLMEQSISEVMYHFTFKETVFDVDNIKAQ